MRYKNTSRYKVLIQVGPEIKELLPNQVFESNRVLNYKFLVRVDPPKPRPKIIRKPQKKSPVKDKLDGSDQAQT
jgi:hypothetical protein